MVDGSYLRRAAVGPMSDRRAAGALAVLAGAMSALPARERDASGNFPRPALPLKVRAGRLLALLRVTLQENMLNR
jgi:hypothetical protein